MEKKRARGDKQGRSRQQKARKQALWSRRKSDKPTSDRPARHSEGGEERQRRRDSEREREGREGRGGIASLPSISSARLLESALAWLACPGTVCKERCDWSPPDVPPRISLRCPGGDLLWSSGELEPSQITSYC